MIARRELSKLLLLNNNKSPSRTSGHSSNNGDSNSGDSPSNNFLMCSQCQPNNSGDSLNKLHHGEKPKGHLNKIGCKFNHHSSLPGRLREVIQTVLVDRDVKLRSRAIVSVNSHLR